MHRVTPKDDKRTKIPKLLSTQITTVNPQTPPWSAEKEIGYVLAAGAKDAVRINEAESNHILCLIPIRYRIGLRLGDPLVIWDYVEKELFGGVIAENDFFTTWRVNLPGEKILGRPIVFQAEAMKGKR